MILHVEGKPCTRRRQSKELSYCYRRGSTGALCMVRSDVSWSLSSSHTHTHTHTHTHHHHHHHHYHHHHHLSVSLSPSLSLRLSHTMHRFFIHSIFPLLLFYPPFLISFTFILCLFLASFFSPFFSSSFHPLYPMFLKLSFPRLLAHAGLTLRAGPAVFFLGCCGTWQTTLVEIDLACTHGALRWLVFII